MNAESIIRIGVITSNTGAAGVATGTAYASDAQLGRSSMHAATNTLSASPPSGGVIAFAHSRTRSMPSACA